MIDYWCKVISYSVIAAMGGTLLLMLFADFMRFIGAWPPIGTIEDDE